MIQSTGCVECVKIKEVEVGVGEGLERSGVAWRGVFHFF